jgi:hypothetical protein
MDYLHWQTPEESVSSPDHGTMRPHRQTYRLWLSTAFAPETDTSVLFIYRIAYISTSAQ